MGSSLRDIPGAGGSGRRRRGTGRRPPAQQPWRPPRFSSRGRIDRVNLLLGLSFAAIFLIGGAWLWRSNSVDLSIRGIEDGGAVRTAQLEALAVDLVVEPADRIDGATVRLDGEDITDELEVDDDVLRWVPGSLGEGAYELELEVPRSVAGSASHTFRFAVDDTAPELEVPAITPVAIDEPLALEGTVDEAVVVTGGGEELDVEEAGTFTIDFDVPPAGGLTLVASDRAGNSTEVPVVVPVRHPATHAVYVAPDGWADDAVRAAMLDLLESDSVNAVVLDVKDECGVVVTGSEVELATRIGARGDRYDLSEAAAAVHDRGGRLIARVVAFRDPMLTRWAWSNDRQDVVLRDTAAFAWPGGVDERCAADNAPALGGGYADFTNTDVWGYVRDLAVEAAASGADDVLLDDVRRPDGDLANMALPGLRGSVEETLGRFLAEVQPAVREQGAYLGASIAGLSVRDPLLYGQDLAQFAAAVDFIAPEVYPESYSTGFFNLAEPVAQPGLAVAGAVGEAAGQLGDLRTALVPWLQDYSGAVPYGVPEVQAQVSGAQDAGACSYIRYDPAFTYSADVVPAC